jgi:hypothetical protein
MNLICSTLRTKDVLRDVNKYIRMHDAIGAVCVPRGKGGSTALGLCVVDMACGHESHCSVCLRWCTLARMHEHRSRGCVGGMQHTPRCE